MKIVLNRIKQIQINHEDNIPVYLPEGLVNLNVLYCAVCRTDAKLWNEGHRELILPRVPGHEIVVEKEGNKYVVWPGIICGKCKHCLSGNTNLCEEIQIIGFHKDGGFSNKITIPEDCLLPVPENVSGLTASFAEPAGCIVNAFKKLELKAKERILIFGGGNLGLLTALLAKEYGAIPVVIEKNETKIAKAEAFCRKTSISVIKDTTGSNFDCVLNACPDSIALFNGITRADKGGRIVHFSGLHKNEQLESNLLNLVHYKELKISGAYGLTKNDMAKGLQLLGNVSDAIGLLIEKVIAPSEVIDILPKVINSESYKYVINFTNSRHDNPKAILNSDVSIGKNNINKTDDCNNYFQSIQIPELSKKLLSEAQEKIDHKTKPLGSLGTLENIAVKMCLIQDNLTPSVKNKSLFVFAADHGITEEGVSAFPQKVTRQMVLNFLKSGAAINVLCKHNNINLSIIDVGVKGEKILHPCLIDKRIAEGTKNFALENAMTPGQTMKAIKAGIEVFEMQYALNKTDIVGLGEMGIGNTTSATAIICAITGKTIRECTGRGTGIDDQGLNHKIKVIEKVLNFHKPDSKSGIEILSKIGGFEIAAMVGVALSAASKRCAVVLDGLISTAAGLLAFVINPDIAGYLFAGHKSVEKGHVFALEYMGLNPVLDLNMRLGEGTGAALTIDLIDASCHIMCEMASFDEAGVTEKNNKSNG